MIGKPKNELEMTIIVARKAIEKLLEDKPDGGLIVEKGTPGEGKMKYKKALKNLNRIDDYFGLKGAFSLGMCGSCEYWSRSGHNDLFQCIGTCDRTKQTRHRYDGCSNHSKEGGGWGL